MSTSTLDQAFAMMERVPLIDGHNDWPHLIRGYYDNRLDFRFDRGNDLVGHVDVKRLRKGKCGGVFMSAYVDWPNPENDFSNDIHFEPMRDTLQQIDLIHRLADLYSDDLAIVERSEDIMKIFQDGKIACIISIEGLHQIGNSSSVMRNYYRLGVRCVTLAHNRNNKYADCAARDPVHYGLSAAGKQMIMEMNRVGIMIDLSHVSHSVMRDVLTLSQAPVIFTHSSCHALVPVSRNVPDDVIDQLGRNKGVLMVSLIPALTHKNEHEASVDHVVDHVLYVAQKIGFEHIGLGSDFDGMEKGVTGLEDVAQFPNVVECMMSRGIATDDIESVMGRNLIRVMREVENTAKQLNSSLVLEDEVKQLWDNDFRSWAKSRYPHAA
ncbi:membrane dipeptidase GliJ [Clohesyomyces aquaticus]|uniref:Dipeptidase n=1 Tax=Clohesyomyces aquaticus TaxID=1231657 RepID=A0A1Y1ZUG4_9PLEO|nr:membrane dipeptidase GliJ [Clohesyomyces aquaticus]